MNKNNNRLPVISLNFAAFALLLAVAAGCGKERGGPMPPPGTPPKPQALHPVGPTAPEKEALKKAIFAIPASSVRRHNGRMSIVADRVIHT